MEVKYMFKIMLCLRAAIALLIISSCAYSFTHTQDPAKEETNPPKIIQKTDKELESEIITRVEPVMPPVAKWAKVHGRVIVQVLINERGEVISAIAIVTSTLLKHAAASAVREWKFKPMQANGKPVKVMGTINIKFEAESPGQDAADDQDELDQAKAAVEIFQDSPEAYFWLGELLELDNQYKEAVTALKKAIELKPDYEEAYEALVSIYKELKQPDEVFQTYKQAVEKIPDSIALLRELGNQLGNRKLYAEAVNPLKHLLEIHSDDLDAANKLGWYYMQLRRLDDAVALFSELVKNNPTNSMAFYNLGWAYFSLQRYNEALEAYQH